MALVRGRLMRPLKEPMCVQAKPQGQCQGTLDGTLNGVKAYDKDKEEFPGGLCQPTEPYQWNRQALGCQRFPAASRKVQVELHVRPRPPFPSPFGSTLFAPVLS